MKVARFRKDNAEHMAQAAQLLRKAFPQSYSDCAEEEVEKCLDSERVAFAAVEDDVLIGFVGAIPQYGTTGFELHPLVVAEECRSKGVGTELMRALEMELRRRGCLTVYLGSDDENGSTTLSNTDLFEDTYKKIESIQNIKRHAFEFYQKVGYKIVGVIPDANGVGKPDIWLAKSLTRGKML